MGITVRPVNDAPVAHDQAVETDEDTTLSIVLTASDIEGDALTYAIVTRRARNAYRHGLEPHLHAGRGLQTAGRLHLQGQRRAGGLEHGHGEHHGAAGQRRALAHDQTVATDEDTALPIVLTASDVDGDTLKLAIVTGPAHGTLSGTGGEPSPTHTRRQTTNGPDGFTFKANDGQADSNTATVRITVRPVNDAPLAHDQTVATDEDTALPIVLTPPTWTGTR